MRNLKVAPTSCRHSRENGNPGKGSGFPGPSKRTAGKQAGE